MWPYSLLFWDMGMFYAISIEGTKDESMRIGLYSWLTSISLLLMLQTLLWFGRWCWLRWSLKLG